MRLKLSLLRPGGEPADVVVTADVVATVADVAQALATRDPQGRSAATPPGDALTLRRHGDGVPDVVLDLHRPLVEAPLAAGAVVSLAAPGTSFADPAADRGAAAAVLTVHTGPDAGRQVELLLGTSTLGRDPRCDVVLKDPLVSKRHARLVVGEVVEVVDAGSSNGVLVSGGLVTRAVLGSEDVVLLGDTEVSVRLLARATQGDSGGSAVAFNRSPVLQERFAGQEVPAPEPPAPAQRQPLPLAALLAPLVLGAAIYLVTRSLVSLVFVALTPLLAVAGWMDGVLGGRRQDRAAGRAFTEALAQVDAELDKLAAAEREARLRESPSTAQLVTATYELRPLLWSRRPDLDRFLELRLGLGAVPSRSTLVLPNGGHGQPRHWRALLDVAARHAHLDGAPVTAALGDLGVVGVSGRGEAATGIARSLVVQAVTLHSPAEVVVAATTGTSTAGTWQWLKWLPHTSSPSSPLQGPHLAVGPGDGAALVSRLEELVAERSAGRSATSDQRPAPVVPTVLLVVGPDSPVERSRLVHLAETGPAGGVVVLWCAAEVPKLPAACRAVLDVSPAGAATAVFVRRGEQYGAVACESVPAAAAEALARRLSPVVDSGALVEDGSDLPRSVGLLDLLGPETAHDADVVLGRWEENESLVDRSGPVVPRHRDGTLRALVGLTATEPLTLDLRSQGPHALVGGTTGAGKSEFLQSWVLGMAAAHSPDRVTFLFVDYKGGSAFGDCVRLPHCVGLVTDLSPHLVRRALTSLRAELRHREEVLVRAKKKDLLDMERSGDPSTPPSLVIVVDEFAALATEVPEFVDGVVDVAQRGRSLGLHLILATQRPAGVIKENLRANTNLRIALRMADEEDSTDVLGVPLAAQFDPAVPGRGAARSGPTRLTQFQSGYVGGVTSSEPTPAQVEVEDLAFGPARPWAAPAVRDGAGHRAQGAKDIVRLVATVTEAAARAEVPAPRLPWRDVLAPGYDLEQLHQRTDREIVIGYADDPAHQDQYQVAFTPDTDGNMVVLGTGGSGKSTALRTVAVAAAITPRSGPVHVYALDFGAGGMALLESLPHVGAVISGEDHERIARLLDWLRGLVDERAVRYATARAATLTEYRRLAGQPDEPRVLLLLDGLGAFRDAYEVGPRSRWYTVFQQIATDGRQVGVHLVVSADRPGAVPSTLASSIQRRLVLRLASEDDYGLVDVPADVLGSASPPGRGVMGGLEVQVAVLGGSTSVSEQARALDRLRSSVSRRGQAPARRVRRLPERVSLGDLPATVDGWPALGLADDTLAAAPFDPRGIFLVAGPPASGRTTTLATLVASVRRWRPGVQSFYLGQQRSSLVGLGGWTGHAGTPEDVEVLAQRLAQELAAPGTAAALVVVEDLPDFVAGAAEQALLDLVAACARHEHFCLTDGETSVMNQSWGLIQAVRAGRRGLALQPEQIDGDVVFRTTFPRVGRGEFPPGRGLLVGRGATTRVQVALPEMEG